MGAADIRKKYGDVKLPSSSVSSADIRWKYSNYESAYKEYAKAIIESNNESRKTQIVKPDLSKMTAKDQAALGYLLGEVRRATLAGGNQEKLQKLLADAMKKSPLPAWEVVRATGMNVPSKYAVAMAAAPDAGTKMQLHDYFMKTDPQYKQGYDSFIKQGKIDTIAENLKNNIDTAQSDIGRVYSPAKTGFLGGPNLGQLARAGLAGAAGVVEGATSGMFNSPLFQSEAAKKLKLDPQLTNGTSFSENLTAMSSLDPTASQVGSFVGQLAQMTATSGLAKGIAAPISELAGLTARQASMLSSALTFGGMEGFRGILNEEDFKTIVMKMGAAGIGAGAGKYFQEAIAGALKLDKMLPGTLKWRVLSLLGDTAFDVSQTVFDPFQLQQYTAKDGWKLMVRDFVMNVLFQNIDLMKERFPVLTSEIDYIGESLVSLKDAHTKYTADPSNENRRLVLDEVAKFEESIKNLPDSPELAEMKSQLEEYKSTISEYIKVDLQRFAKKGDANGEEVQAQEEVANKEPKRIESDPVSLNQTLKTIDLLMAQGKRDIVERIWKQTVRDTDLYQNDKSKIMQHLDEVLGKSAPAEVKAEETPVESQVEEVPAQTEPMPESPDAPPKEGLTRVWQNISGEDMVNLTKEQKALAEGTLDPETYVPVAEKYVKRNNAEDYDAAQAILESPESTRELLQRLDTEDVPSAVDAMAAVALGKKLFDDPDMDKATQGLAILSRFSQSATKMGQAIQSLAKTYIELGIMNHVAKRQRDNSTGEQRYIIKSGGAELQKKAQQEIGRIGGDAANEVVNRVQGELKKLTDKQKANIEKTKAAKLKKAWDTFVESEKIRIGKEAEKSFRADELERLKNEDRAKGKDTWTPKELEVFYNQIDSLWERRVAEVEARINSESEKAWKQNYQEEHKNDKYETVDKDTPITDYEKLAQRIDEWKKSDYVQGPPEAEPLLNLSNEVMRLVQEENPNLPKDEGASAIDRLGYLVENFSEYKDLLDKAFRTIEEAYLADPTKYPEAFMAEVHKYLNTTASIRTQRLDAAIKQAYKETGISLKDLVMDWNTKAKSKLQTLTDYIVEKTKLSEADAKLLTDELAARFDELKTAKRDQIVKNLFKTPVKRKKATLEDKYMQAISLGILTDSTYRDIWAEKMGFNHFSSEMARDINTTMKQYFEIEPDRMYPVPDAKGNTLLKKWFGSQYDGAKEVPGWYVQQQMHDALMERMAAKNKASLMDKQHGWAYFAMMSSPTSWIKNPLSNTLQFAWSQLADIPTAAMQSIMKRENRTVGFGLPHAHPETVKAAHDWYERTALPQIKGIGIEAGIQRVMSAKDKTFETKWLETVTKIPWRAMELGDMPFLRGSYALAFEKYLNVQKYHQETDPAKKKQMEQDAHDVAMDRALEDTYRDLNTLAIVLNKFKSVESMVPYLKKFDVMAEEGLTPKERRSGARKARAVRTVSGAIGLGKQVVVPFVNTMLNITKRTIEYSPYGLVTALGKVAVDGVGKDFDGAKLSRNIGKAIIGTALGSAVGYYLASMGIVNGPYPNDPAERKRWEVEGRKPYTIKVGDKYVSLEWAAPAAVPFFMGASMAQEMAYKGDRTFTEKLGKASIAGADAIFNMSFMQNLNKLLGYPGDSPTMKAVDVATTLPMQYIPNINSKIAATIDDTVRSTYYPDAAGAAALSLLRKTGAGSFALLPQYDVWGEKIKQGQFNEKTGMLGRAFNNFLAPYRIYNGNSADATKEVVALYRIARDSGEEDAASVLPDFSSTGLTYNSEDLQFSPDEVAAWTAIAGQNAREEIDRLLTDSRYMSLPDYAPEGESKYSIIRKVFSNAKESSKQVFLNYRGIPYEAKLRELFSGR